NIVWVGTGEKNSLRSQWWGDGVYRSSDGGAKWTNMGLKDTRSIGRIIVHPTTPDIVYVAALGHLWGPHPERGIYKTADGGDRKSTRLNSSHVAISYAVFCLKKKKNKENKILI